MGVGVFTSIGSVLKARILMRPDSFYVNPDIVNEQRALIEMIISDRHPSVRVTDSVKTILRRYSADWGRLLSKSESMSFGQNGDRKGAPAAKLAKRAARAERDREIRNKMKSRKGG